MGTHGCLLRAVPTTMRTALPEHPALIPADVAPEIGHCLGWVRATVRLGIPVVLMLVAIESLPSAWAARIPALASPAYLAVAASVALAAVLFASVPRLLDARDPRGAGRQAGVHGTAAAAGFVLLAAMLGGWIVAPAWVIVAGTGLVWFGGTLLALRDLAASAARLGSAPEIVARLERRTRAGAGVWLVGLAAIAAVAAVGLIAAFYGTDAAGGREAATVHRGPAFALARLVALALTGYACVGLACWGVVFEVVAAGIATGGHVRETRGAP
jgi:hypothetical protein